MGSRVQTTPPTIDERPERHTAGIRLKTPLRDFKTVIPRTLGEVFAWAEENGVQAAGSPYMRYYVIDMDGQMDIELGIPVAAPSQPNGKIAPGMLPAGSYASLIYTGRNRGYAGNKALLVWGQKQGLKLDAWNDPAGDAFACRYESFLTNPADEPDHKMWQTEVAIKLADETFTDPDATANKT